jgi:hypothetical protein
MYVLAPPDHNGLGISVPGTERHARFLERYFAILPDSALTYSTWRQLVAAHNVLGVNQILSFNVSDFARYNGIECVDAQTL